MVSSIAEDIDRKMSPRRAMRRRQLILATIDSIAKRGFADTTLAHVANAASLSGGSVNMYFTNKETLLAETLRYLCDEYQRNWQNVLAKAGNNPADQLKALVVADFRHEVSDRKKLGVWFAFMGEAKTRPTYRRICVATEEIYCEIMSKIIARIVEEGEYENIDPTQSAEMIIALCDGLWLSLLVNKDTVSRKSARDALLRLVEMLFPQHFPR